MSSEEIQSAILGYLNERSIINDTSAELRVNGKEVDSQVLLGELNRLASHFVSTGCLINFYDQFLDLFFY